jgi:hypothetical protein
MKSYGLGHTATKGDVIVNVKPGQEVVSINVGWTVEKFVEDVKESQEETIPEWKSCEWQEACEGGSIPEWEWEERGEQLTAGLALLTKLQ